MKKKILALCLVVVLAVTAVTGATLAYFTDTDDVENTFTMGKVDIILDEAPVDKNGKETDGDRVDGNDYTATNMVPGHVFDKDPTIHVVKGSEDSYIFLDMTFNKYSSLFWVMAADASADKNINFTIFKADGTLKNEFKNDSGVFSSTKFISAMMNNKTVFQAIIGKWFEGIDHEDWTLMTTHVGVDKDDVEAAGKYMTLRFAYQGDNDGTPNTVNAKNADANIDIKFMDSFGMPATVTQEMISNATTIGGMQNAFNTTAEAFHMNFAAYAIQADGIANVTNAYGALFEGAIIE